MFDNGNKSKYTLLVFKKEIIIMKKLMFILSLCLIVPCAMIFTGCGHKHKSDSDVWEYNSIGHWHQATCEHTEEKVDYDEHLFADNNDNSCNTCGYLRETANFNIWDGTLKNLPDAVENVIEITTAEQLAKLAKMVESGLTYEGFTVKLMVDIDLNNKNWTPIGYGSVNYLTHEIDSASGHQFRGTFDGNNKTIYNLKINQSTKGGIQSYSSGGVGFIGLLDQGIVKNLTINGANIVGNHYVGAVVGYSMNGTIENCNVVSAEVNCRYSNSDDSGDKAGAVVGFIQSSTVKDCNATNALVKADRDAGQLIGCQNLQDSVVSGNIVENVVVSWNQSGSTPNKSNTNIKNELIGRLNS